MGKDVNWEAFERVILAADIAHGRRLAAEGPFLATKGRDPDAAGKYAAAYLEERTALEHLTAAMTAWMTRFDPRPVSPAPTSST